jgi:MoaA/NifB/PqqE/SkfB family radical SAM enzyme
MHPMADTQGARANNMASAAEQDTRLHRLMQWRRGETPGPWQMVVFPTNRCNLKCTMCWQRWVEEKWGQVDHSRELSDERLMRLVDEAADMNVREWNIGGGGDPMVRGELVMRMCARIRERGMNGGIFTNGTLFRRDHLEHLVRIGWDRVDFSLDGPTAAINDAIRSEGSFDRAVAAMRELMEIRGALGATRPVTDVHIVLTRLNFDHLDDMVRMIASLGAKQFGFSFLNVQTDQCATLQLLEHQWRQLPEVSRKMHALGLQLGMASSAWTIPEALQRKKSAMTPTGTTTRTRSCPPGATSLF